VKATTEDADVKQQGASSKHWSFGTAFEANDFQKAGASNSSFWPVPSCSLSSQRGASYETNNALQLQRWTTDHLVSLIKQANQNRRKIWYVDVLSHTV